VRNPKTLKTTGSKLKITLLCSLLALMSGLAMAQTTPTLGLPTVVPMPANPVYFDANDSRFPYLPNATGTANITYWVDGVNFRSEGASLDTMNSPSPSTSVLGSTAGAFDQNGAWLLAAIRRGGTLYGFYHAEDHSCGMGFEWNSSGLATSTDDGATWVKQGEIIGSPNTCSGSGGVGASTVAWDAVNSRWIGWGGANVFVSTNANAAAGTWFGYHNGSFSTPMPGSGPLTALPSLGGNNASIDAQSVAWNSYLGQGQGQWVMVYTRFGDTTHIYYRTSSDGINWSPQTTLLTAGTGQTLNYAEIIGDTGETCGQDALLVYEIFPSANTPGRSRDMTEQWIHWGPLTIPAAPANLTANGQWGCQQQVALTWNATTQTQNYNVFRSTSSGGSYTNIASFSTSASFPTYIDLSVVAGTTYFYKVQATNTAGASGFSSIVSAVPAGAATGNTISIDFDGGNGNGPNPLMDCSDVAGVVPSSHWNNAVGASGTLANLVYDAGASSGATLTWSSPNIFSIGIPVTPGNYRMMNGYLDGSTPSVTISNIPPAFTNTGYNVYVYSDGDAATGRVGRYTIGSTSITATDNSTFAGTFTQASNSAGNYVVFPNVKTSQFTLSCLGVLGGTGPNPMLRAPVNGIQIIAIAQLTLNLSTTYSDPTQVYVTFQSSNPATFTASYVDATTSLTTPILMNAQGLTSSIPLSNIAQGVITLNHMDSGLIYASVGGPLGQTAAPSPNNPSDPAYNIPWQNAAEITYTGTPADSGDITSINFFSVPVSVQVLAGSQVVQHAGINVPAATLYPEIAALSTTPGQIEIKATQGPNTGQIVRILSPNQFGLTTDVQGTAYFSIGGYQSFQNYVRSINQANVKTYIQGSLAVAGNITSYNFTSVVNSAGDIVTTGNYVTNGAIYTITIPHDYPLTDGSGLTNYTQSSALYFCPTVANSTTGVTVTSSDGSTMNAAVLAQVLHDLCSGYNFGFVNSRTPDPKTHIAFGAEPSYLWFVHATTGMLYSGLQPNHPYYNQFAQLIAAASNGTAYGFPYADAVPGVTLNTVQYPGTTPPTPITAWNITIGAQ
jgi:hypothetical protein